MKFASKLSDIKIIVDSPSIKRLFGYGIILYFDFFPLITLKNITEAGQVVHAYNASVWEVEAEESGVQDHSVLHSQFKVSLDYL